jgi:hypothetical protein
MKVNGLANQVHSDQKVLKIIRRGRLVLVIGGQESQTSSSDNQAQVPSDQMVLVIARREAGPCERRPTQGLHSLMTLK